MTTKTKASKKTKTPKAPKAAAAPAPVSTEPRPTIYPDVPPGAKFCHVPLAYLPDNDAAGMESPPPSQKLVDHIRHFGVLQPIPVQVETLDDNTEVWHVGGGKRRIKAAREAGLDKIPAFVFDLAAVSTEALVLAENELRSENAYADYTALRRLMATGMTEKEIAAQAGMAVQTVRSRMKLDRLEARLMSALATGKISMQVALEACRADLELQAKYADFLAKNGHLKLSELRKLSRAARQEATAGLPGGMFDGGRANPWTEVYSSLADALNALPKGTDKKLFETLQKVMVDVAGLEATVDAAQEPETAPDSAPAAEEASEGPEMPEGPTEAQDAPQASSVEAEPEATVPSEEVMTEAEKQNEETHSGEFDADESPSEDEAPPAELETVADPTLP